VKLALDADGPHLQAKPRPIAGRPSHPSARARR
jgi:hypothetical protein